MFRYLPHYLQHARDQIYGLPVGHWFFQAYDRLIRTPQPEGIVVERPVIGLVRPPELELYVAI